MFILFLLFAKTVLAQISYECGKNEVLVVNSKNSWQIGMNCGKPRICFQSLKCKITDSKKKELYCDGEKNFVSGVYQKSWNHRIDHKCCTSVADTESHIGNTCFTHKMLDSSPLLSHRLNTSSPFLGSFSLDQQPRKISRPFRLKLLPPRIRIPPVMLVKGISRIRDGYKVTFCRVKCDYRRLAQARKAAKAADSAEVNPKSTTTLKSQITTTAAETTSSSTTTDLVNQGHIAGDSSQPATNNAAVIGNDVTDSMVQNPVNAFQRSPTTLIRRPGCFSRDMTVRTPDGARTIDSIDIGTQVLVAKGSETLVYEPIELFYHKEFLAEMDFLVLKTVSQKTISLTPDHLLIIRENCTEKMPESFYELNKDHSLFASRIQVGQCIPILNKEQNRVEYESVLEIRAERKLGFISPMTATGTLVVNDVHVSCFSKFESHGVQQLIYRILKFHWRISKWIRYFFSQHLNVANWKTDEFELDTEGMPKFLKFALALAELTSKNMLF